jgi:hypothetical protein
VAWRLHSGCRQALFDKPLSMHEHAGLILSTSVPSYLESLKKKYAHQGAVRKSLFLR